MRGWRTIDTVCYNFTNWAMGLESLEALDSPVLVGAAPVPVSVGFVPAGFDSVRTSGQPVVSKSSLFQPKVPG